MDARRTYCRTTKGKFMTPCRIRLTSSLKRKLATNAIQKGLGYGG
jgi:hypothetical protein